MSFDQQGLYGMFFDREVGCIADVSSVSQSLRQTEGLWGDRSFYSTVLIYAELKVRL